MRAEPIRVTVAGKPGPVTEGHAISPNAHTRSLVCLVLLLLLVPAVVCAGIYKWTDAQGRHHFSDKRPPSEAAEEVSLPPVNTFKGVAIEETTEPADSAASPSKSKNVVMYSAPWCGVCRKARSFFREQGIAVKERDIEQSRKARTEFDRLGGRGVPLILVGDRRMNGFSPESFLHLYER